MKKAINFKLKLCYDSSIINPIEKKDILFNLISNFTEIELISKSNESENLKFLYFNRKNIHKILIDSNKIISINLNKTNLSDYFYLSLLILENSALINYKYSFEYILQMYQIQNQILSKSIIKKLIFSKLCIELINYFLDFEEDYDGKSYKKELKKIENENRLFIKNNINIFRNLNINITEDIFLHKKIDEIYIMIIISLIKNDKLSDYEYTYNIITQLNLESININHEMFKNLSQILENDETYIKKYKIKNEDDLIDKDKINFYFVLLKYILKNNFFIYYSSFLLETKKNLMKKIKSKIYINNLENYKIDNIYKERLEYIIKWIFDSDYYLQIFLDNFQKYINEKKKNISKKQNINNNNLLKSYYDSNSKNKSQVNNKSNTNIIVESIQILNSSSILLNNDSEYKTKKTNTEKISSYNSYISNISKINYRILEFIKILGRHQNQANFIQEFSKNYLISGGSDNKVIFYDEKYNIISEKLLISPINNIIEIIENKNNKKKDNNNFKFLCCTKKKIIYLFDESIQIFNLHLKNFSMCINFGEKVIVCTNEGIFLLENLFAKILNLKELKIINKSFNAGIQIEKNIFAFTSNNTNLNGEDIIIFYNIINKKKFYEIKNYSFIISTNGLTLIQKNEIEPNNRILLCACKKYIKGQKNGILLINYDFNNNKNISYNFYQTGNYEVHCFCQIFTISLNKFILKKNISINYSDYILVGGYDKDKGKGIIKLYKLIDKENISNSKIEYIQDIDTDIYDKNFNGFKGSISSIIQSKKNGKLLISCWDGNTYLFAPPNLDYFIFYDNQYK